MKTGTHVTADRLVVPVLYAAVFLDMTGFSMLIPDIQLRAEAMGLRGWAIGGILSSMFIVQALLSPVWGRVADRRGKKGVIAFCTALSASSMFLYGFAKLPALLLGSRVLSGLGAANISNCFALLSTTVPESSRAKSIGRMTAASMLGLGAGPLIGSAIYLHGQLITGLVAGSCSLLAVVLVLTLLPKDKPALGAEQKSRPTWQLLRQEPAFGVLFLLAGIAWISLASLEGTFGRLIELRLGLTQREFGWIFGYESILAFLIQTFLIAWMMARAKPRTVLIGSYILMGIGLAFTPAAPALWVLFLVTTVYAVGSAYANPTINDLVAEVTEESHRGEAYGLMQAARSLGFFVGPALGGILFDWHYFAPYTLAGCVCVLAAAVAWIRLPK